MKALITVAAILSATASAQMNNVRTIQDCRMPLLATGAPCVYQGTTLPMQRLLGDINLPPLAHFTEPYSEVVPITLAKTDAYKYDFTALGTIQSETLGYPHFVSTGFKLEAAKPLNPYLAVAMRGTIVRFRGIAGAYNENNHTEEIVAGPRIEIPWRVRPYFEALLGAGYQYRWGMPVVGVGGVSVQVTKQLSFIPAEGAYEWFCFQPSAASYNPRRGRIELSSGLSYRFGSR